MLPFNGDLLKLFKGKFEMKMIKESVAKFIKDEDGLTTVEYAVAGALVAAAVAGAFTALGTAVTGRVTTLGTIVTG